MLCRLKNYALAVVLVLALCTMSTGECLALSQLAAYRRTTTCIIAHSVKPRALKRLSHPSTLALEIVPRQPSRSPTQYKRTKLSTRSNTLQYDDTFRLTLSAFGDTFYLHLRPNHDLIHPNARVNFYHAPTKTGHSQLYYSEPLLRESVKAYWGEVVHPDHSTTRMEEDMVGVLTRPSRSRFELGWARIMMHHQGDMDAGVAPIFEGAFTVNGITYNVVTRQNYLRHKHPFDPVFPLADELDQGLVIWRDLDVMSEVEEQALHRGASMDSSALPARPRTCGHDSLQYNIDPRLNPALQKPFSSYDTFGLLNPILGRNDIAGSGSGDK
jgi:hypothetical protein